MTTGLQSHQSIYDAFVKHKTTKNPSQGQTAFFDAVSKNKKFQKGFRDYQRDAGFKNLQEHGNYLKKHGSSPQFQRPEGGGNEQGLAGLSKSASVPTLNQEDTATIGNLAGSVSKLGWGKFGRMMTNNPYLSAAIVGGGVEATKAIASGDLEKGLSRAFSGSLKGAANHMVSKLGVPVAAAMEFTMATYNGVQQGHSIGMAMADAGAKTGISLTGAVLGGLIGGPFGSLIGGALASAIAGSSMITEGWIGDAFNVRAFEDLRDQYEEMGLSDEDKARLDRMTKVNVEDSIIDRRAIERTMAMAAKANRDRARIGSLYGTAKGYGGLGGLGRGYGIGQEGKSEGLGGFGKDHGDRESEPGGMGGV